jgi:3-hydroxyisobutyrate dehydrogenase-like beta-hydroxyacid dehydrogenase
MGDITVIGSGAMGSALARTLLKAGNDVVVWNRSPEKTAPLVALGAKAVADFGEALRVSPRIMVCIADYAAILRLFDQPDIAPLLEGRTVIQLSTGTPKEAADSDAWIRHRGGTYLDGAIMVNPGNLGAADAQILIAGPEEAFRRCQDLLQCLGGDLRYLGANVRAAASLDLALLTFIECMVFGVIHGARICEAEGVPVAQYAALLPPHAWGRTKAQVIHDAAFEAETIPATVEVVAGVAARLQEQARDAAINSEIPDMLMSLLARAVAAGYGRQDSAAVIKVLRGGDTA